MDRLESKMDYPLSAESKLLSNISILESDKAPVLTTNLWIL
jgi:hypothetical protein